MSEAEAALSWEDDEVRWIARRSQYLASEYDLKDAIAEMLAYSELGHFTGSISRKMDVSPNTVKKYKDRLMDQLGPGPLTDSPPVPDHPEAELNTAMDNLRVCPSCGDNSIVSVREAEAVFPQASDSLRSSIKDAKSGSATHVCSSCSRTQAVDIQTGDGEFRASSNYRHIPESWREHARWLCWKEEDRNGKLTKVPIAPWATEGVRMVDKGNPHTWASFETAAEYAEMTPGWGLGYVFVRDGPFVGVDLDDCIEDGELTDDATAIVDDLDSYTEYSPSGTGLHIIVKGELPAGRANKNDAAGVEVYDRDRFFTVTGDTLEDRPIEERTDAVAEMAEEYLEERDVSLSMNDDFDGEAKSPLYGVTVEDLYPELPVGTNCEHPIHGSSTGSNFKIDSGGEVAICWHGSHAVGQGDGCGLSGCHLLAMEAVGSEECDVIRKRWGDDDELVFETWKYAIEEYDLEPEPAPTRALAHLAEQVGHDIHDDGDIRQQKAAYRAARLVAKHNHDIDIDP